MTARRQHYVWKHYLRAWSVKGKIAVARKGHDVFLTNPVNVAVARDFYRLPRLTKDDRAYLEGLIAALPIDERGKELARGWLTPSAIAELARIELLEAGALTPEALRGIEEYEIELDERYHALIERNAFPLLEQLRLGNKDFWCRDERATIDFCYFIALQHLRTKRMADIVLVAYETQDDRDAAARRWPVLRHIFATNFGMTLYLERDDWRLQTFTAPDRTPFITADQPVMNLLSAQGHNDMALYYPVSPTRAVIIEHAANESCAPSDGQASEDLAHSLNRRLFDYAHEQAFGTEPRYLQSLDKAA